MPSPRSQNHPVCHRLVAAREAIWYFGGNCSSREITKCIMEITNDQQDIIKEKYPLISFRINYVIYDVAPERRISSLRCYVIDYVINCRHYETRENKSVFLWFLWLIKKEVRMPRSCCVPNCTNNAKSKPEINFYIIPKEEEWRKHFVTG